MVPIMIIVGLILIGISIIISLNRAGQSISEPFEIPYVSSCPAGLHVYYDKSGDALCCDGIVSGNTCSSAPKCSMTTNGTMTDFYGIVPSCVKMQQQYYTEQGALFCPPSMPHFFVGIQGNKHCTSGNLNSAGTGPANTFGQTSCGIFDTPNEHQNQSNPNSCYNHKKLDAVKCFGEDCIKTINVSGKTGTALISVGFTDQTGIRHSTFTRDSYQEYLNRLGGSGASSIDLTKNIAVTEVAKAVYIDKTMSPADVQV